MFFIETIDSELRSKKTGICCNLPFNRNLSAFYFSECIEDKIFIFYIARNPWLGYYNSYSYLMVVCAKTMDVLNNAVLTEHPFFVSDDIKESDKSEVAGYKLDKSFYHEKRLNFMCKLERKMEKEISF